MVFSSAISVDKHVKEALDIANAGRSDDVFEQAVNIARPTRDDRTENKNPTINKEESQDHIDGKEESNPKRKAVVAVVATTLAVGGALTVEHVNNSFEKDEVASTVVSIEEGGSVSSAVAEAVPGLLMKAGVNPSEASEIDGITPAQKANWEAGGTVEPGDKFIVALEKDGNGNLSIDVTYLVQEALDNDTN